MYDRVVTRGNCITVEQIVRFSDVCEFLERNHDCEGYTSGGAVARRTEEGFISVRFPGQKEVIVDPCILYVPGGQANIRTRFPVNPLTCEWSVRVIRRMP